MVSRNTGSFALGPAATLRRSLAAVASLAFALAAGQTAELIDLPYASPSDGSDGALAIPGTLPLYNDSGSPMQVVYDVANGYLLASALRSDGANYLETMAYLDGHWEFIQREGNLIETAFAYDAARQQVVRFGGYDTSFRNYENQTRVWTGEVWDFVPPENNSPPNRSRAAMAYDAARQRIVLFGGEGEDDELGDTWTWDGSDWTEQRPASAPSPRMYSAMAYDPVREQVVLFGGDDGGWLNDTWTWNGTEWTEQSPANVPPDEPAAMAFDPNRSVMVLVVNSPAGDTVQTWEWDGSNWTQRAPALSPPGREYHGLAYNPQTQRVELYNGSYTAADSDLIADSWQWDGTQWTRTAVSPYLIDMSQKPDGIWNFTTIDIGDTTVRFLPNDANTPVYWFASGDVSIRGDIDVSGQTAQVLTEEQVNTRAAGGPGGYAGGLGGYYEQADGSDAPGQPGFGPAGGAATTLAEENGAWDAFHGAFNETYGSPSLQVLKGGSGGGGARSSSYSESTLWGRGGNGGGGGGAILIASSGNIFLEGRILARGGEGGLERYVIDSTFGSSIRSGNTRGGSGSGGAIRLVADRILGAGHLDVSTDANFRHDQDDGPANYGRIRLETFYHRIFWGNVIEPSISFPKDTKLGAEQPRLAVASIAGQSVSASPSGDPAAPDVAFAAAGDITVLVTADNVPDGTDINLRVTSGTAIVEPNPVALSGGEASFTLTVPAGSGVVQAYADWSN